MMSYLFFVFLLIKEFIIFETQIEIINIIMYLELITKRIIIEL